MSYQNSIMPNYFPIILYDGCLVKQTCEQPGLKAPGTENRIPFLSLNTSLIFTELQGVCS